jgi:hypothetical protein
MTPSTTPEDGRYLADLVRRAFFLRVGVVLLLHLTGFSLRLAPDEQTFAGTGEAIAAYWVGDILVEPWRLRSGQPLGYFYLNAISFLLFGSALPLKLFNAFLGAITCLYSYRLAHLLFGSGVARRTALFAAYFPSLVLWSAVNIRDVWVIFLIVWISWKSLALLRGYSHLGLVGILLGIAALSSFRGYLFLVVALPPIAAFLIGRRGDLGRNFVLAVGIGIGLIFMFQAGLGEKATTLLNLETLDEKRRGMLWGAESAFEEDVDISTPGGALRYLPIALLYFFFSPFPWQMTSPLRLLSLPEMLLIYGLTPSAVRGLRHIVRTRFRESLQVLLLTVMLTVSYALGSGNVGTLYRHRAQAIVFYLMFASVGLELRRPAHQQRRVA